MLQKICKSSYPLLILLLFLSISGCSRQTNEIQSSSSIKFEKVEFQIDIADTQMSRTKGLSGTESLDQDEGLLFDFKEEGDYGIWMKDMDYSLDILWIDKNFKVVHIEEFISPDTFPKVFNSTKPARYVLEINAGQSSRHKIQVGNESKIFN